MSARVMNPSYLIRALCLTIALVGCGSTSDETPRTGSAAPTTGTGPLYMQLALEEMRTGAH